MDFLKKVTKELEKSGMSIGAGDPPRYWTSTGNYVLNKIISGSFLKGIPQGRLLCFTGPSQSGKSFLVANAMREAQKQGVHVINIDAEHALDDAFVSALGVDTKNNYTYIEVDTIPQAKKAVSSIITAYREEYADDHAAPKMLITLDSLDMLQTETEREQFTKGVTKGDQGQRNKQLKAMLRSFVHAVKHPNIAMIVTDGVYPNQEIKSGEGVWIVKEAIKYSLSQIILLTKLKLKDKNTQDVEGIRMKCMGYKTRFAKPFQNVTIEVPYDTGMDPYNGLLEVAVSMDIVQKKGQSRYIMKGQTTSWYSKEFAKYAEDVLLKCEAQRAQFLDALVDDEELDLTDGPPSRTRRKAKHDKEE